MAVLGWLIPLSVGAVVAVISIAVTFRRLSSTTVTPSWGGETAPTWLRRPQSKNYLLGYATLWVLGTAIGLVIISAMAYATGRGVSANFVVEYLVGGALGLAMLQIAWLVYRRLSR
jgi:FtsH-binding integral membrane protein